MKMRDRVFTGHLNWSVRSLIVDSDVVSRFSTAMMTSLDRWFA